MGLREYLRLPEGTLSGVHTPDRPEALAQADCVIVQEFTSDPDLFPNQQIVDYLMASEHLRSLPLFVSGSIATALRRREREHPDPSFRFNIQQIFSGHSAANDGENLGTYGELLQFIEVRAKIREIRRNPKVLAHPVLVTSGYNVGNVKRQATQLGMDVLIPPKLPRGFDRRSKQLWTKNRLLWSVLAWERDRRLRREGH